MTRPAISRPDLFLLLTALIWGSNYSVLKFALEEVPARSFNGLRLVIASLVFLGTIAATRRRESLARLTPRHWLVIVVLGIVGQFGYQLLFIEGLERTSVANASIIISCVPVIVSLTSAVLGHERLPWPHWVGMALSFAGVYLIVSGGAQTGESSLAGDLMMVTCAVFWTIYTIAARPLLNTFSPLLITGLSMAVGTVLFIPTALDDLRATSWGSVSIAVWVCLVFSSLLALNFAYTAWYHGVRHLGASRTSLYSNVVPVAALLIAMAWLGERLAGMRLVGAVLVIIGVVVTRYRGRGA
jgi:drug/metabolite transporter (DMT)-like permease